MWDINELSKLKTEYDYLNYFNIKSKTDFDRIMLHHLMRCVRQFLVEIDRFQFGAAEYWVGKGDGIQQYFLHRLYEINKENEQ